MSIKEVERQLEAEGLARAKRMIETHLFVFIADDGVSLAPNGHNLGRPPIT
jgi:hypothetical protein